MLNVESLLADLRKCIRIISQKVQYFLIVLYIPKNPIGFVTSEENLISACSDNFEIIHDIRLASEKKIVLFLKSNYQ